MFPVFSHNTKTTSWIDPRCLDKPQKPLEECEDDGRSILSRLFPSVLRFKLKTELLTFLTLVVKYCDFYFCLTSTLNINATLREKSMHTNLIVSFVCMFFNVFYVSML